MGFKNFLKGAAKSGLKKAVSAAKEEAAYFAPIIKQRFKDKHGPEMKKALHDFLIEAERQSDCPPNEFAEFLRDIANEIESNQTTQTGY